jgi:NET1-associated nuclear protein 1 (U3 small nucleolar RNA-associated protein 17)
MVLWQLDTGQKQFLPHLSAPIESLVVSPSGAFYAVRLADNSAMVLSTAELQPTVSILGIQLATSTQPKFKVPVVSQISEPIQASSIFRRPAVAISKDMPGSVLLAVTGASSSRIGVTTNVNAAYLQSVDVRSGSQLSRQALTRTKVTDRTIGPELNILEEPNIVLLQVSDDGAWMATVEEWTPPQKDVDVLVPDQESVPTEQISRMEMYLKFWHWDAESMKWKLVARVEAPHNTNDCDRVSVGRVLDLIPGPSSSGFVTIGDEGQAKLWRPKARYRDGVKVKGIDGQTLINWTCYQNILLPGLHSSLDKQIMARLALSDDGSFLVVGYRSESQSLIFMIDVVEGTVQHIHSDIFTGPLIGLGVLDKYLIILADQLIVWDIVDDQFVHIISLTSYGLAERNRISATHLAIDRISKTFAVSVPEIVNAEWLTTLQTQLVIFDPAHPLRLYHTSFPHTLKALIPSVHRNGFISIDTTAHVRTISRTAELPTVQEGPTPEKGKVKGLANIYGDAFSNILKETKQVENAQLLLKNGISESRQATTEEGGRAVVRKEALTDIFERGHPFALPPVTKIFEQVAKLFIGKANR